VVIKAALPYGDFIIGGVYFAGCWMFRDSILLQARSVKVLPHINDALLIFSAIGVAYSVGLYPWGQPWMAAKLVALMVYILLGTVALKRGSTKAIRVVAWVLALLRNLCSKRSFRAITVTSRDAVSRGIECCTRRLRLYNG